MCTYDAVLLKYFCRGRGMVLEKSTVVHFRTVQYGEDLLIWGMQQSQKGSGVYIPHLLTSFSQGPHSPDVSLRTTIWKDGSFTRSDKHQADQIFILSEWNLAGVAWGMEALSVYNVNISMALNNGTIRSIGQLMNFTCYSCWMIMHFISFYLWSTLYFAFTAVEEAVQTLKIIPKLFLILEI